MQTETCKSCPADCCDNPMNNSILVLVLVLVGVALVVVGVVLGVSSQRPEGPKVVDEMNM